MVWANPWLKQAARGHGHGGYPTINPPLTDPGPEYDPYVCACQIKEQLENGVYVPILLKCDWYRTASAISGHVAAANSHMKFAMTLQAGGYKGSTHPKALERATKERDRLR